MLEFLNRILGPNSDELVLQRSELPKFKQYISTLDFLRFFLFPVNALLLVVTATLISLMLLLDILSSFSGWIFKCLIDSRWLSPTVFGITEEEYLKEYVRLGGTNAKD